MEELNSLPAEVMKGTELEVVLMQLKDLTTRYVKKQKDIRKKTLEEINTKLSIAEDNDDSENAKILRFKIQTFDDEFVQQEWDKCTNFTLLEDERPSMAFLTIES